MVCLVFVGSDLPVDTVKKAFFRKLVMSDFIQSFSEVSSSCSIQNLFVLILANRDSDIRWFTPAPRFTVSQRGKLYNIGLTNQPIQDTSLCVSASDSLLEMSGINPMETTADLCSPTSKSYNTDLPSPTLLNRGESELSTPVSTEPQCKRRKLMATSFEEMCDIEDVIWYQAPVTFKGFK